MLKHLIFSEIEKLSENQNLKKNRIKNYRKIRKKTHTLIMSERCDEVVVFGCAIERLLTTDSDCAGCI